MVSSTTCRSSVELTAWLEEHNARTWDHQIEEDLKAGRLDALLDEVDRECAKGFGQPL